MIAILSPHLDDAVLSCWTLLTSDEEVRVVNVFSGIPDPHAPLGSWDEGTGAVSSQERMRERIEEDRDVLAGLGRGATNSPLLDAQYLAGTRDTKQVLDAITPAVDGARVVYAPSGIGGHPDHVDVRVAAGALWRRGQPLALYAELPYCNEHGWPGWVSDRRPESSRDVTADWQRHMDIRGEPRVEAPGATVRALSEDEQERKRSAVLGYRTQRPAYAACVAEAEAGGGSLGFELFWQLGAPAAGAGRRQILWHLGMRRGSRLDRMRRRIGAPFPGRIRPSAR